LFGYRNNEFVRLSLTYFGDFEMIEALKEEQIVNKVGGRFKLSTLIQKRLVALNAGARPLVDAGTEDKLEVIVQEILQDKIYLDTSGEVKTIGESGPTAAGPPEFDFSAL
jgi:DNA-directed RNA polymerase subunit omega